MVRSLHCHYCLVVCLWLHSCTHHAPCGSTMSIKTLHCIPVKILHPREGFHCIVATLSVVCDDVYPAQLLGLHRSLEADRVCECSNSRTKCVKKVVSFFSRSPVLRLFSFLYPKNKLPVSKYILELNCLYTSVISLIKDTLNN